MVAASEGESKDTAIEVEIDAREQKRIDLPWKSTNYMLESSGRSTICDREWTSVDGEVMVELSATSWHRESCGSAGKGGSTPFGREEYTLYMSTSITASISRRLTSITRLPTIDPTIHPVSSQSRHPQPHQYRFLAMLSLLFSSQCLD